MTGPSLRTGVAVAALVGLLVAGVLMASDTDGGAALDTETRAAIASADIIVVATVNGLVDQKPQARGRRGREMHRVTVTATLKGAEATGDEVLVRPNGNDWDDGASYAMLLHRSADRFASALLTESIPATKNNIAAVRAAVAEDGSGVDPRTVIYAEAHPGWSTEPASMLLVREDGRFEAYATDSNGRRTTDAGKVAPNGIAALKAAIADAPPGIRADDGGLLKVRWRDADGVLRHAEFDLADGNAGVRLNALLANFGSSAR